MYRLDRGRLDTTFSIALPRSAVEVTFGPEGITRRIAVDTFINQELPPRYRSFTLTTNYVFGERRFRIVSESLDPEWADGGGLDLSYWGLVHQPTFANDLARLQERQKKSPAEAPWALDPVELVKRRFPDARDPRVFAQAARPRDRLLRARRTARRTSSSSSRCASGRARRATGTSR